MKKYLLLLSVLLLSFVSVFAQELVVSSAVDSANVVQSMESKMCRISGGSFFMGAENQEANEVPVHSVSLDSYFLSSTEVTQKEYAAVMNENFSMYKGENLPVEEVSWYDAVVFCNRLSIMSGLEPAYSLDGETDPDLWGDVPRRGAVKDEAVRWNGIRWNVEANGYRLPTEAEWEYASRGGAFENGSSFSGGNQVSDVAWTNADSESKTHEAGTKSKNALGLFDMSGNVWEWCWDWYGRYSGDAKINPDGAGEKSSGRKVRKGGSFKSDIEFCRCTNRASTEPEIRGRDLGFRVAKSAEVERSLRLGPNEFDIDIENFPYSVLVCSFRDEKSALDERNRLSNLGVKSYVLKKYLEQDGAFHFDLHVGYFSSEDEAKDVQSQLKDMGMKYVSVEKFTDAQNDFDSYVKKNCVAYDSRTLSDRDIFSDSIKACLGILPASDGFQIEYLELADFDTLNAQKKNLAGLMLEDFFPDSTDLIHSAAYVEYADRLFNRSLMVIAAEASGGYFSTKAETFASSFMDGVYEEGNFSLRIGDIECTVVKAYGQLVLCGNNQDGSLYMLMFARGFSEQDLNDFVQNSFGHGIGSYAPVGKILYAIPECKENSGRDFMKFTLSKIYEVDGEENSLVGLWNGNGTFIQDEKEIEVQLMQMEYYSQAQNYYREGKSELENGLEVPVAKSVPGIYGSKSESEYLFFASGSYIVGLLLPGQNVYDDLENFAKALEVWR